MIKALCFNCGAEKSAAIKLCNCCRALPTSREDRIVSACLSSDCLRQDNLRTAVQYMRLKNRLPGFHDKVRRKAEQIVDAMPEEFQVSQSFDLEAVFSEEEYAVLD